MISSYRLGDLVCLGLNTEEKKELLKDHPDSIGGQYILETKSNNRSNNIDIITKIVLEHIQKYADALPKDISDSTVIHLRLGDVVAGNEYHEKLKRPLPIDYIKSIVSNDTNKKYVIGKCFLPSQALKIMTNAFIYPTTTYKTSWMNCQRNILILEMPI